jgi:biotin carboxylase
MVVSGLDNMKRKRLLIIGAGEEQAPAYEFAIRMGLNVVGSDINPKAPAFHLTKERIIASTRDSDSTLREVKRFHQRLPIDVVITVAHDASVTVAKVASELGLKSISIQSAKLASNKLLQLEKFRKDGIPVPKFRELKSVEELNSVIAEWGYPLVIKPLDNRGARGVLRLTNQIDTEWAFFESLSQSQTGSILAQEFVSGPQISSETLVVNGKGYTAMYSGRNYEFLDRFSPYMIENGGPLPADITEEEKKTMDAIVQKAADSLGIENGPLKGDLVCSPKGVVVLEFAARLGGGYACSHSIPLTHGVNLVEQLIKMAVDIPIDIRNLIPKYKQSAVIRFFFPEPGIIKAIRGFDELDQWDWVKLKKMYLKVGDRVERVTDHTKRAGCVIVVGQNTKEAEAKAEQAIKSVEIITG